MSTSEKAPAPSFGLVPKGEGTGKVTIGSLDEPGAAFTVSAQYNPKELKIDRPVTWGAPKDAGKGGGPDNTNKPHIEFGGVTARTITIDFLFDGYEKDNGPFSVDVVKEVQKLEVLASVRKPGSKEEQFRRPHRCVVVWGSGLPKFQCVIEGLTTTYSMFDTDGTPLRATVNVKLKEADVVKGSEAPKPPPPKKKPADKPAEPKK